MSRFSRLRDDPVMSNQEDVRARGAPDHARSASEFEDVGERKRPVAAGASNVLNFAPAPLTVPETVSVRQVDLGLELQVLSYYAARDAEAG